MMRIINWELVAGQFPIYQTTDNRGEGVLISNKGETYGFIGFLVLLLLNGDTLHKLQFMATPDLILNRGVFIS